MSKSKDIAGISNQEMTREEALSVINAVEEELSARGDTEMEYKLDRALCVLGVYEQPDPITGLVPCGCGGDAEMHFGVYEQNDHYVECRACHIGTRVITGEENATRVWNTAMGYTAPPRPGAIGPDAGEMAPNGDEGEES